LALDQMTRSIPNLCINLWSLDTEGPTHIVETLHRNQGLRNDYSYELWVTVRV